MIDFETYVILLPPDAILGSKCTQNAFAAETLPRTPLGVLQRSPELLAVFEGPRNFENRSTPMTVCINVYVISWVAACW